MEYCFHCMAEIKTPQEKYCPECGNLYDVHYAQSFELPAGTYLCDGRYIVGRSLGAGGFGITYIGFDVKLNKKVVIKETFYSGIFHRNSQNKTLSEPLKVTYDSEISLASIMTKTQKECFCLSKAESFNNIVKVYDWFTENNTAYIITEYINGETLFDKVKRNGKYEWRELYAKFRPLMQSLAQLHTAELLHRDIKPLNIMIRSGYRSREDFVLIDFGLARSTDTKTLASVGIAFSPGYSPFEQRTLTKKDGTFTDVYSLAATMYFALTGASPQDEVSGTIDENFPLLKALKTSGDIPQHVAAAFEYALQPDYRNRCRTVDEFINLLDGENNRSDDYETPIFSPYNRSERDNSFDRSFSSDGGSATRLANSAAPLGNGSFSPQTPPPPRRNSLPDTPPARRNSPITEYQQPQKKSGLLNFLIVLCVFMIFLGGVTSLEAFGVLHIRDWLNGLSSDGTSSNESVSPEDRARVSVPDLAGLNEAGAKALAEKCSLNWAVTYQPTDSVTPGMVVTQFPLPGSEVNEGDKVDIFIAKAFENENAASMYVTIPDVVDTYYYDAATVLINKGLKVEWKDSYSETIEADKVVRQEPKAETNVDYGATVTLYIAKAIDLSQYVKIEDYTGRDINEVKAELESQGLDVIYSTETSYTLSDGEIISQSIDPGKYCAKGTTIKFVAAKHETSKPPESSTSSSQTPQSKPPESSTSSSQTSQSTPNVKSNDRVDLTGSYTKPIFHHVTSSSYLAASGGYTYSEQNILNNNGRCWSEGADGDGIGEYVMFWDENVQSLSQCTLINGYNESSASFNNNGRLTKVTFEFSDGKKLTYEIDPNSMAEQTFYFGEIIRTTSIKVIITEARSGDKYQDTCLSLIVPK